MEKTALEPLTEKNSLLLLIDYQPAMFKGIGSGNRTLIRDSAVAAATAAKILDIPVVLSSISPKLNGEIIPAISGLFANQETFARKLPSFDAFEDENLLAAVRESHSRKIVIPGLWTSMCFAFTALHGVREGLDVYGLFDASGDATPDSHRFGIKRMIQAGVIPITWITLVSEWMHDWANPKAGELMKNVYSRYEATLGM